MDVHVPFRSWLPDEALGGAEADRRIGELIAGWSAEWFARRTVRMVDGLKMEAGGAAWNEEQLHILDGLQLSLRTGAIREIAGMILDLDVVEKQFSPWDRKVVERLAVGCLDDLRHRLAHLFGLPADAHWLVGPQSGTVPPRPAWGCLIAAEECFALARLSVNAELMVALARSGMAAAPPAVPLETLAAGLGRQPVLLSALLGRCELTLAELAALAEGDVLIFDRALAAPLDLAVDDQVKSGRCIVDHAGEQLVLKIQQPLSR